MAPTVEHSPLGKNSQYQSNYDPSLLFSIERKANRDNIGVQQPLPFHGFDRWQAFELSWLDPQGKPVVAFGEFLFPCLSPYLIESKSLKLYLNSFNQSSFKDYETVSQIIQHDLSQTAGLDVQVSITALTQMPSITINPQLNGTCLDPLPIAVNDYQVNAKLLTVELSPVRETVYSHLLRSNCPVTNQPDWGTVAISYDGPQINHANLLKYIISFRQHNEFHEQCIERMFVDIQTYCQPNSLTISAFYARRGGLNINPMRSSEQQINQEEQQLIRQ